MDYLIKLIKQDTLDNIKKYYNENQNELKVHDVVLLACIYNKLDVAKWFSERITLTHTDDAFKNTCITGRLDIAKWLLDKYPNIDIAKDNGKCFILLCSNSNNTEFCEWLLELNPDLINYITENNFYNMCRNSSIDILQLYLDKRPEIINFISTHNFNAACRGGSLETAKWILQLKPDIIDDENEAFCMACIGGNFELIVWLLKLKPSIDITANNDKALRSAYSAFRIDIAIWLIRREPNHQLAFYKTIKYSLFTVTIWYYKKFKHHIDMSAQNEYAFRLACENDSDYTPEWLLQKKPDINISADNNYAFRKARENGHIKLVQWLLELQPSINITDTTQADFIRVCKNRQLNMAKWLIENVATLEINEEIFKVACENGDYAMAQWVYEIIPDIDLTANDDYYFHSAFIIASNDADYDYKLAEWIVELEPNRYKIIYDDDDIMIDYFIIEKNITINKSKIMDQNNIPICSICMNMKCDVYVECSHCFCKDCLTTWVNNNRNCPYCRSNIDIKNDLYNIQYKID